MKAIICDFDGTLIKKNSFPMWVFYILKCSLRRGGVPTFLRFSSALFLRRLGMMSVSQFKAFLMGRRYPREYDSCFVDSLKIHINPFVVERLNELDGYLVLSSAAPIFYLEHVADNFGVKFDKVVGTHVYVGILVENYSENKVLALQEVIDVADDVILFTDHYIDLPLMRVSDEVFLVNPRKKTVNKADREGVNYKIIKD
jgi:phosphoserine phosphatase